MTDWLLYKRKAARLSVSTDVDKKVSNQVVIFCERFFFSSLRWFECFFLYLLCPLLLSPSFIIIIFFFLDSMVVALCLDAQVEKETAKLCKC